MLRAVLEAYSIDVAMPPDLFDWWLKWSMDMPFAEALVLYVLPELGYERYEEEEWKNYIRRFEKFFPGNNIMKHLKEMTMEVGIGCVLDE